MGEHTHWSAGLTPAGLSRFCERVVYTEGIDPKDFAELAIAGGIARLAKALERVADLMDPEVRKQKEDATEEVGRSRRRVEEANEIMKRWGVGKNTRTFRPWRLALINMMENDMPTNDPFVVADYARKNIRYTGKMIYAKMVEEAERAGFRRPTDGGAP